jgi:hypothetical protein
MLTSTQVYVDPDCPFLLLLVVTQSLVLSSPDAQSHETYADRKCLLLLMLTQIQEFGYERTAGGIEKLLAVTRRFLARNVRALRQMGSGVLDLAYVAAGRVDGVYTGVAGEGQSDQPALVHRRTWHTYHGVCRRVL